MRASEGDRGIKRRLAEIGLWNRLTGSWPDWSTTEPKDHREIWKAAVKVRLEEIDLPWEVRKARAA